MPTPRSNLAAAWLLVAACRTDGPDRGEVGASETPDARRATSTEPAVMDARAPSGQDAAVVLGEDASVVTPADARAPSVDAPGNRTCASMEAEFSAGTNRPGRVCVQSVPDVATWQSISLAENAVDVLRSTSYFLPYTADANIPPSFLDANTWQHFPKAPGERAYAAWHVIYASMFLPGAPHTVFLGPNRKAIAGVVLQIRPASSSGDSLFAYSLQGESLGCAEEKQLHAQFQALFKPRPLFRLLIEGSEQKLATAPPTGCAIPVFVLR